MMPFAQQREGSPLAAVICAHRLPKRVSVKYLSVFPVAPSRILHLATLLLIVLWATGDTDKDLTGTTQLFGGRCAHMAAANGLPSLCCAKDSISNLSDSMIPLHNVSLVCLPQFIIAGTQKSGTTALAALLSEHRGISFSPKKEVHFFDRSKYFKQGLEEYMKAFRSWNYSNLKAVPAVPIYGEATPFYIASKDACRRIAQTLPGVKMIVLMREPVARAYSEYQMKRRRVAVQNEFISAVQSHEAAVHRCMVRHRGDDWKAFRECMPEDISSHSHYPKLVSALKGIVKESVGGWNSVLSKCFARSVEGSYTVRQHGDIDDFVEDTVDDLAEIPYAKQASSLLELYLDSEISTTQDDLEVNIDGSTDLSATLSKFRLPDYTFSLNLAKQRIPTSGNSMTILNRSTDSRRFVGGYKRSGYFQPHACLGKYASETIRSVYETFHEEMTSLQLCGNDILRRTRPSAQITRMLVDATNGSRRIDRFDPWSCMNADEAEAVVRGCVNITSGISNQYLYRSMYAPQISKCLRYISRDNFLFLSSEQLDREPKTVIRIVLRFLGFRNAEDLELPNLSVSPVSNITDDYEADHPVRDAVEKHFPRFERATGWRLRGEYAPIPNSLNRRLSRLFQGLNVALTQITGKDFRTYWTENHG